MLTGRLSGLTCAQPLWGIWGTVLDGREERSSEDGVGWSSRTRMAENRVPKATGREVGGWWEAAKRGIPGSVPLE